MFLEAKLFYLHDVWYYDPLSHYFLVGAVSIVDDEKMGQGWAFSIILSSALEK